MGWFLRRLQVQTKRSRNYGSTTQTSILHCSVPVWRRHLLGATECILTCSISWCMTWSTTTLIFIQTRDVVGRYCLWSLPTNLLPRIPFQFSTTISLHLIFALNTITANIYPRKTKSNIFIVTPWFLSWSHYYKIKLINNNVHKLKNFKGDGGGLVWKIMMEWVGFYRFVQNILLQRVVFFF